ncbi:MAG: methyl-accepting chemotaxis protein, partial [Thermomonas sp.]
ASQEQSSGIEQVNQAITQMDEGTQQNAALVEEASASAESMRQQAAALVEAVAAFRLANQQAAKAKSTRPAPAAHASSQPDADEDAPVKPVLQKAAAKPAARRVAAAPVAATPIKRSASSTAGDQHWQEF